MDLRKIVNLHYGKSPVEGATSDMQDSLDRESEFCAVYAQTDVPARVHNQTTVDMLAQFGVHTDFAEEHGSYIKPYQVEVDSGKAAVGVMDATVESLEGSGFRCGGMFFYEDIAEQVVSALEQKGYEIVKKYD